MFEILVIDDTKSVQAFVKSLLGKVKEIHITSAMNGAEAMELIKKGEKFDLVFLDWEMPIMNGPETFQAMKDSHFVTPVIMMTTKNTSEDIEKMLMMGVSEYLMKPFTIDIIFEKIEFVTGKVFKYDV